MTGSCCRSWRAHRRRTTSAPSIRSPSPVSNRWSDRVPHPAAVRPAVTGPSAPASPRWERHPRCSRAFRRRAARTPTSPRPTATPSAWSPPAVSTTPGARSPAPRRSRRWCRRWWRGPTPTTSTGSAPRPAIRSGCARPGASWSCAAEADDGIPRGAVAVDFNVPHGTGTPGNAAATLIDSRSPVTDVRLESV